MKQIILVCAKTSKILLLASLLLGGISCAHKPPANDSLYHALGERQGIENIVRAMIFIVAKDERVKPRFKGVNIAHFKQGFSDYVCMVAGGPCQYQGESLAVVHAGHQYTNSEFNAIVEHLILAMEQEHIPLATQNKLLALLAPAYKDVVYQ
jgi:hemoglobin